MKNLIKLASYLAIGLAGGLLQTTNLPAAGSQTLWQIGKADHNNAEFALAPNGYGGFQADGYFLVGESDARRDWPYVQPGPDDGWGGGAGQPHTFSVVFGLKQSPGPGECRLQLGLLDTQSVSPPRLRIQVNGQPFERALPKGAGDESINGQPAKGRPYELTVPFPANLLQVGDNEIQITTLSGSWLLYDWLGLETPAGAELTKPKSRTFVDRVEPVPAVQEKTGRLFQPIRVTLRHFGEAGEISVQLDGVELDRVPLKTGSQSIEVLAPAVSQATPGTLAIVAGGQTLASQAVTLQPIRKWEVYVLMHSHTDIGYTDLQPNIEKKQAHNVVRALELIRETKDYPVGARFKWNLEVMWTADQFARIATPEQMRGFNQAIHDGNIGVDAFYGNLLTGLCRSEELSRQISFATALGRRNGVTVDSMMISDVPGLTWGIVPALADQGVKYISDGPNASRSMDGDRIGYVRVQWENNPFYWLSPSGREKVLYWGAQGGYSFGHHFSSILEGLPFLLRRLEEQKYPYDIVQLRWTKGDNGPPDEGVMGAVRDWNAKYAYPKLTIATTSEAFHAFEKRYGAKLPTFRGDMTPYWEDGSGSSARETALNRHSVDRLLQAETLWAMRQPGPFPVADFATAWKNAALYSEHTWGAYNSVSQPDLKFVKDQWKYKQGYALHADEESHALLNRALGGEDPGAVAASVDVFNTASWPRTDLVTLPKETRGDLVQDDHGEPVPSQRLSTGELAFLARDVPAFGAKRFTIQAGASSGGKARAGNTSLSTPLLNVQLDAATGDIVSLRRSGIDADLAKGPINNYLYLPGGNTNDVQRSGPARITVQEAGPLVVSLRVESSAPGCNQLVREVRLVDGLDRVEISNLVDKKAVRAVEGVHFGFSFNVPDPEVRINSPGTIGQPEKDQLPGACKNWFSVERWVDISNDRHGVTWSTADAPLMEMGGLTANLPRSQPNPNAYLKSIKPSATIYSWVMNNHWHTNYRADQAGPVWFHYAIQPHESYDAAAATRFGVESTEPLLVAPATGPAPVAGTLRVEPATVVATAFKPSDDGKALIVRLFNPTGQPQTARLHWNRPVGSTWLSSGREDQRQPAPATITVPQLDTVTVRVEP